MPSMPPETTSSLPPDLRGVLGRVILEARAVVEGAATEALEALAVGADQPHVHMRDSERTLRKHLLARGRQAGDRRNRDGTQQTARLAQEVAYAHWHRMLFARFLAENGLLIAPNYGIAVSLEDCLALAREEGRSQWELAGEWAQELLPRVFPLGDPVFDLSLSPEKTQELEGLLESLPVGVFTARDSLGWTYQYWRAKEKDRINKSGVKIGADELPAATQLFTERYMVLFLLHNTVGAWRAGKILAAKPSLASTAPDEATLRHKMRLAQHGGYDFDHLRFTQSKSKSYDAPAAPAEGGAGPWRPAAGSFESWPATAKHLRILDPCCGSGHFLVEVLELLAQLRMEEEGLSIKEAVQAVLRDNVFGLEIDPRCAQIAAFNVALSAWRLAGEWIALPRLNVACTGIRPEGSEADWVRLADKLEIMSGRTSASGDGRLQSGVRHLYHLFRQARTLGSLIDPSAEEGDLLRAGFGELEDVLDSAIRAERLTGDHNDERTVMAAGMARAAEILRGRYTLVTTNVPFVGLGRQSGLLRRFAAKYYSHAKRDLATVFLERSFSWLRDHGTLSLVTPQHWLFLKSYETLRRHLLKNRTWDMIVRLGTSAFQTITGEAVNVALVTLSARHPDAESQVSVIDLEDHRQFSKETMLSKAAAVVSNQKEQACNPDAVVMSKPFGQRRLLKLAAEARSGKATSDRPSFGRLFWELPATGKAWVFQQSTVKNTTHFGGRKHLIYGGDATDNGGGWLATATRFSSVAERQYQYPGCTGVAVSLMSLHQTLYWGEVLDNSTGIIEPFDQRDIPAIWTFCSSSELASLVRQMNRKMSVEASTLVKVPFDRERWTKAAEERYPNGLPEPYSDDPTQWIFHGDPCRSVVWDEKTKRAAHGPLRFDKTVLQVAVARLLGYRWPAEDDPAMRLAPEQRALVERASRYDDLADADGIVCLSSARRERSAEDRLRELLARAYGGEWSAAVERRLIAASLSTPVPPPPPSLHKWLRDYYFIEHCRLFHHRPFVWHVWDGRKDGFHALVNYHKLAGPDGEGRRTLESLAFAYLHDWILRQRAEQSDGAPGADARLEHALDLQAALKRILEGEPPCDLFVRWKPLYAQAMGWDPDSDDGARLNIRPFMMAKLRKGGRKGAGVLRWKPNVKWGKDRGREPEEPRPREDFPWFWGYPGSGGGALVDFGAEEDATFDGNRWNDLHYTQDAKERARDRAREQPPR